MRRYFAILFLALLSAFVGSANAGALWRGYCYSTPADAVLSWCGDAMMPQAIGGIALSALQPSSTVGSRQSDTLNAVSLLSSCYLSTATGNDVSIIVEPPVMIGYIRQQLLSTGTGYTWPVNTTAPTAGASLTLSSMGAARNITFPACTPQPTDSENVAAIVQLWPYGIALVATAWGAGFIRRRIVRWNESGGQS